MAAFEGRYLYVPDLIRNLGEVPGPEVLKSLYISGTINRVTYWECERLHREMEQQQQKSHTQQEEATTMVAFNNPITVGKVILGQTLSGGPFDDMPVEVGFEVVIDAGGISLMYLGASKRASMDGPVTTRPKTMTAEQAREVAQLLMKASELQPKYAEEHKRLADEVSKLNSRFTSLADGTGEDVEVDVADVHSTFVVRRALED